VGGLLGAWWLAVGGGGVRRSGFAPPSQLSAAKSPP